MSPEQKYQIFVLLLLIVIYKKMMTKKRPDLGPSGRDMNIKKKSNSDMDWRSWHSMVLFHSWSAGEVSGTAKASLRPMKHDTFQSIQSLDYMPLPSILSTCYSRLISQWMTSWVLGWFGLRKWWLARDWESAFRALSLIGFINGLIG